MSEIDDRARRSSRTRLLMPPYGRELAAARRRGESPNVFLHGGDRSWDRAKLRAPPEVLCLPPDANHYDYDWSLVQGLALTLIVWNREPSLVDSFARQLVIAGASLVAALSGDERGTFSTFYRPRT